MLETTNSFDSTMIFEALGILLTGSNGPFSPITLEGEAKAAASILWK